VQDFLFVATAVGYMVLVLLAFLYYDSWTAMGGAAFLLPYFVFMLHSIPGLKGACIEKYVTSKRRRLPPAGEV
jgi:SNF family Na+-dependent transporter